MTPLLDGRIHAGQETAEHTGLPGKQSPLEYDEDKQELVCRASGLAYPVRDDIPVMLESEARQLSADEKLHGG